MVTKNTAAHQEDDLLVRNIYGPYNRFPTGEVGIEIEVEGPTRFPALQYWWRRDDDGSLRGNSAEYVLKTPVKRESVLKTLKYLQKNIPEVSDSPRTGVHVHINMLRSTNIQVFNMITLYMIFEDLLVEWCGTDRVGNHFCLRTSDAKNLHRVLMNCAEYGSLNLGISDSIRYASLNISSIRTYGSLEFRALRGTTDPDLIYTWVQLLLSIKDYSSKFKCPFSLIEEYSNKGVKDFTREVFKKNSGLILGLENSLDRIEEGMFHAQGIAASFKIGRSHWEKNQNQVLKKKPKIPTRLRGGSSGSTMTFSEFITESSGVPSGIRRSQPQWRHNPPPQAPVVSSGVTPSSEEAPSSEEEVRRLHYYNPITDTILDEFIKSTDMHGTPPITAFLRRMSSRASAPVNVGLSENVVSYNMVSPSGLSRRLLAGELQLKDIPQMVWLSFVQEELATAGALHTRVTNYTPDRDIEIRFLRDFSNWLWKRPTLTGGTLHFLNPDGRHPLEILMAEVNVPNFYRPNNSSLYISKYLWYLFRYKDIIPHSRTIRPTSPRRYPHLSPSGISRNDVERTLGLSSRIPDVMWFRHVQEEINYLTSDVDLVLLEETYSPPTATSIEVIHLRQYTIPFRQSRRY